MTGGGSWGSVENHRRLVPDQYERGDVGCLIVRLPLATDN